MRTMRRMTVVNQSAALAGSPVPRLAPPQQRVRVTARRSGCKPARALGVEVVCFKDKADPAETTTQDAPSMQRAAPQPIVFQPYTELELDELAAKYTNLDDRLDTMERHIMELTRELRSGTASVTGGLTAEASTPTGGPGPDTTVEGLSMAIAHGSTIRGASDSAGMGQAGRGHQIAPHSSMPSDTGRSSTSATAAEYAASGHSPGSAARARVAGSFSHRHVDGSQPGQAATSSAPAAVATAVPVVAPAIPATPIKDATLPAKALHLGKDAVNLVSKQAARASHTVLGGDDGAPDTAEGGDANTGPDASNSGWQSEGQQDQQQRQKPEARVPAGTSDRAGVVASAGGGDSGQGHGDRHGKHHHDPAPPGPASHQPLLPRDSVYEFNKLQAGIIELINSGYIESVKQLRETLMIMEWDMSNKHLAKRRAVAAFERHVAEKGMVQEVGGYAVISALYDNPDALHELLPNDKLRMLARAMMEESLNDRRTLMYHTCNQTAKELASLTGPSMSGNLIQPLGQGILGGALKAWRAARSILPF